MPKLEDIRLGDLLPQRLHEPTTVDLFFYNAALWNGHRIHFDQAYTTAEEGYPGLVVQGPLQGDWLSQCVMEWLEDGGELLEFEYRNRAPAYVGEVLESGGRVESIDPASREVRLQLFVRNAAGQIICPGSAVVLLR